MTPGAEDLRADYFGRCIEYANGLDRAFFAAHPNVVMYERPLVPGEFRGQDEADVVAVLVRFVAPSIRLRAPMVRRPS